MRFRLLCFLMLVVCPALVGQRGAITKQQTLPELIAPAGVIVRGHVIAAAVEPHPQYPNLMTVVVTVSADSVLKGTAGKTYTFRQFIWDQRDLMDAAGFRKGQEWLLVMNPVNVHGLTSPVGLEQGRFRIMRDEASGKVTASNGRRNAGLLTGSAEKAQASKGQFSNRSLQMMQSAESGSVSAGPVELQDLEDAIRGFVGANR
jgi:hypothetical protein